MSRAFLLGVAVGVEDAESVVTSESVFVGRNGVGMRYMPVWWMRISTAENLSDPFAFVVSEDEHNGAILNEITRVTVAVGGSDVVGDELTVVVELGH